MNVPASRGVSDGPGDDALSEITELASRGVTGCEAAGLSLLRGGGIQTLAPTDALARTLDDAKRRSGTGPCLSAIGANQSVVVDDLTSDWRWPALRQSAATTGLRSVLSLPLAVDGVFFGALNLYATEAGVFDEAAQQVAQAFAQQATSTLRYRQLFEAEHAIAQTLQWGLLPEISDVEGLTAAARYLPSETARIGGDWYDLLPLPDAAVGLAVGDVMGHGVNAAAAMGQLRSVLRSYAWEGHGPAAVLDRLDHLVQGLGMAETATTICGRLTLDGEGTARLVYANAGHPPPLIHHPDGTVRLLEDHSILIGASLTHQRPRPETMHDLPAGSTVVFYTDGLVESRARPVDQGLAQLRQAATRHQPHHGPKAFCDLLTSALAGDAGDDDIALLAVQIRP